VCFPTEPLKLLLCDAQDINSSRQVRVYLQQQAKKNHNNNNNNKQVQAQDIRRLHRQAGRSKGCGKEEIVITRKGVKKRSTSIGFLVFSPSIVEILKVLW
jgi:hypothetical protein